MSRGPGHLTTAIAEHLAAHPSREFTIGELARVAYPGVPIEKKHRVATARAVKKLAPGRLKRREPLSEGERATARGFAELSRAVELIGANGNMAALTALRDELSKWSAIIGDVIDDKQRRGDQAVRNSASGDNEKAFSPINTVKSDDPETEGAAVDNVVNLRRRRPDWKRREPRRREVHKWYDQYHGWTLTAQTTARMYIFNEGGRLPDAAYYNDEPGSSTGNGAVGTKKRSSKGDD